MINGGEEFKCFDQTRENEEQERKDSLLGVFFKLDVKERRQHETNDRRGTAS